MRKIIRNSAECFQCGDKLESKSVHDFKSCSCGNISVDGGKEYIRRLGDIEHKNSQDTSVTEVILQCTILSGPSGAGKSTFIKKEIYQESVVLSADHFFMVDGEYKFDPTKLSEAHNSCLRKFIAACQEGEAAKRLDKESPLVVVENTNTTVEEIAPYYSVAKAFGYEVELVTLHTPVELATKRNVHGVPFKSVQAMQDRIAARKLPPFWNLKQTNLRWTNSLYGNIGRFERA